MQNIFKGLLLSIYMILVISSFHTAIAVDLTNKIGFGIGGAEVLSPDLVKIQFVKGKVAFEPTFSFVLERSSGLSIQSHTIGLTGKWAVKANDFYNIYAGTGFEHVSSKLTDSIGKIECSAFSVPVFISGEYFFTSHVSVETSIIAGGLSFPYNDENTILFSLSPTVKFLFWFR